MALPVVDDLYRWTIDGVAYGQDVRNTFYFRVDAVMGTPSTIGMLTQLVGIWNDIALGAQLFLPTTYSAEQYSLEKITGIAGTPPLGPFYMVPSAAKEIISPLPPDQGAVVGPFLPEFVQAPIVLRSEKRHSTNSNRPVIGGLHLGPLAESATEDIGQGSLMAAAVHAALSAFIGAFLGDLLLDEGGGNDTTVHLIVGANSYLANGAFPLTAALSPQVTVAVVGPRVSSQLSRKIRQG